MAFFSSIKKGKRDSALEKIVYEAMDEVAEYFSIPKDSYDKRRPEVYASEDFLDICGVDGLAGDKEVHLREKPKLEEVYEEAAHSLDMILCYPGFYFWTYKHMFHMVLLEAFGYYGSKIGSSSRNTTIISNAHEILDWYRLGAVDDSLAKQAFAELKYLKGLTRLVANDKAEARKHLKGFYKNIELLKPDSITHALGYDLGHYAFEVIEEKRLESKGLVKEMMVINRRKVNPLDAYVEIANIVYSKALV